jgi:transcriptional regulator with XRE-family HTH domain
MSDFGDSIRRLRQSHHMSLGDLAEKVNTSRSFLSQLEQGKTLPSLLTLKSIANAFGVTVGSLVDEPQTDKSPVVRSDERPKVDHLQSGMIIETLTFRDIHKTLQPLLVKMEPGANSGYEGYTHKGQEFGHVVHGQLLVELDGQKYELKAGDSIYFDSSRPHRFINPGKEETQMIWVISPPTF